MREIVTEAARNPGRRLLGVVLFLATYAGLTAGLYRLMSRASDGTAPSVRVIAASSPPRRNVVLAGDEFVVAGQPFFIKAIGWDPARPGELPWTRHFVAAEVDEDFRRIRAAGFNTVRTWAPMRTEELELAARRGLWVLQGIWTPPDADFADAAVRRKVLDQVARSVESSRWSPAILGYLVLNEPRASAVARAGLDATAAYLREVVATVRALDPSAPIGYASWPGLEALDDELLDFVAFNLYPHRPRAAMDELGVLGYARLLKQTVARGRPLLVSEFGISVSPHESHGRGGASEQQQADQLLWMATSLEAAGAAGTSVFQWNDGWWKNSDKAGDEFTHDPDDPEEWFGMLSFAAPTDRIGTPRPALAALAHHNRAVLAAPLDRTRAQGEVPVRVFSEEPLTLVAKLDGAPIELPLRRRSPSWLEGTLKLPGGAADHELWLELRDAGGNFLRTERRTLLGGEQRPFSIAPRRLRVQPGARFTVSIDVADPSLREIQVCAFTEAHFDEQPQTVRVGPRGVARASFVAPEEETVMTLLAFERGSRSRAAPPRAAWASVEVRRSR